MNGNRNIAIKSADNTYKDVTQQAKARSLHKLDTSKNSGRIGDRLIHFVRLKTECWHGWATGVF